MKPICFVFPRKKWFILISHLACMVIFVIMCISYKMYVIFLLFCTKCLYLKIYCFLPQV